MLLRKSSILAACGTSMLLTGCVGSSGTTSTTSLTSYASDIGANSEIESTGVAVEAALTVGGSSTTVGTAVTDTNTKVVLSYDSAGELSGAEIYTSNESFVLGDGAAVTVYSGFGPDAGELTVVDSGDQEVNVGAIVDPDQSGWDYQTFGFWARGVNGTTDPSNPPRYGAGSWGLKTDGASIPTSGSNVQFTGTAGGAYHDNATGYDFLVYSDAILTADFVNRSVTISTDNAERVGIINGLSNQSSNGVLISSADSGLEFDGTLTYSAATNELSGAIANGAINPTLSGTARGYFYGPNAEEIGGVFSLTGSAGDYVGAFGAQ